MDEDTKNFIIGSAIIAIIGVMVVISIVKMFGTSEEEWSIGFVSGTEYRWNEQGQIIVEVRDRNGNAVQSNCNASIFYPNKTIFINNQAMVNSTSGNSYINFTVPNVTGIFEYQAKCMVGNRLQVASKSFHSNVRDIRGWVTQ